METKKSQPRPLTQALAHFLPDAPRPKDNACSKCDDAAALFKKYPEAFIVTGYRPDYDFIEFILTQPRYSWVEIRYLFDDLHGKSKAESCSVSWPFFLSCIAHRTNLLAILRNQDLAPWDSMMNNDWAVDQRMYADFLRFDLLTEDQRSWLKNEAKFTRDEFRKYDAKVAVELNTKRAKAVARRATIAKAKVDAEPLRTKARKDIEVARAEIERKRQEIKRLEESVALIISSKLGTQWCVDCKKLVGGGCDNCGKDLDVKESWVLQRLVCSKTNKVSCPECTVARNLQYFGDWNSFKESPSICTCNEDVIVE